MSPSFSSLRLSIFLATVLAFSGNAEAGCLSPYLKQLPTVPRKAELLVTADFDGNGKPDIAGSSDLGVFVILEASAETPVPQDVYVGPASAALIAADLDKDGYQDLLFANGTSLFRLAGNGDGTFDPVVEIPIGLTPIAVEPGRFGNDPFLDLAVVDAPNAALILFANNGSGGFTESSRKALDPNANALHVADIDADTLADCIVAYSGSAIHEVFYGRSDGTLESPVPLYGQTAPGRICVSDVTEDALPDLVTMSPDGWLATIRNLGSRAFGDPLQYSGERWDLAVADLTGDGIDDPLYSTLCGIRSYRSTGLGTLVNFTRSDFSCGATSSTSKAPIATADFDLDGRIDVITGYNDAYGNSVVRRFRNLCGDGTLSLTTDTPLISVGQPAPLSVSMGPPPGGNFGWVLATGQSTVEENGTTVATAQFAGSTTVPVTINGLGIGEHSFIAKYPGDDQYSAAESTPLTVRVTNQTTTTTLTANPLQAEYGQPPTLTAHVSSSDGTTATGSIRFRVDGTALYPTMAGPDATISANPLAVGTHVLEAEYLGDVSHPASRVSLSYEVVKESPVVSVNPGSVLAGESTGAVVSVRSKYPNTAPPTGTITVRVGSTVLGSGPVVAWYGLGFTIPPLALGRHDFRITYSGDSNYDSLETTESVVVFPSSGEAIDARGSATKILVHARSSKPTLSRRRFDGLWSWIEYAGELPFVDLSTEAETVYLYRMDYFGNEQAIADLAMRIAFTDDPLAAGMTVKAIHLAEIVRATNILRSAANLPALVVETTPGTTIQAATLLSVRAAINEARVALGAYSFPFTSPVAPGGTVAATDFNELREAVR